MDKKCDAKKNDAASSAASAKSHVHEEEEQTKEQLEAEFDPNDKGKFLPFTFIFSPKSSFYFLKFHMNLNLRFRASPKDIFVP